jgi:hypothetical protein
LLLALPLVARHEADPPCQSGAASAADGELAEAPWIVAAGRRNLGREGAADATEESAAQVTQKPFAELGELLKRSR